MQDATIDVVTFRWRAKFGHFLRAEANASALTYPVPPRTAVLGLLGAILGLDKDSLGQTLRTTLVAITGEPPPRFWHRIKLRKDPPSPMPYKVSRGQRGHEKDEAPTLIRQEWLWKPDFRVHVAIPDQNTLFSNLAERIRSRRWHYCPCMGLSELLAEVVHEATQQASRLPAGRHSVSGACPEKAVKLLGSDGIAVHLLRMPYSVTEDRVFAHIGYYFEHKGQPVPVETEAAWQIGSEAVILA